jgi:hypothetical protein
MTKRLWQAHCWLQTQPYWLPAQCRLSVHSDQQRRALPRLREPQLELEPEARGFVVAVAVAVLVSECHSNQRQHAINLRLRKGTEPWLIHPRGIKTAGYDDQRHQGHECAARFLLFLLVGEYWRIGRRVAVAGRSFRRLRFCLLPFLLRSGRLRFRERRLHFRSLQLRHHRIVGECDRRLWFRAFGFLRSRDWLEELRI